MKLFTPQHADVLRALYAERLIPKLYRRLTHERYEATEVHIRRLADWPAALMRQAGWGLLEPVLDDPEAWPAIWHQAMEAGFDPVAHHHHALLFSRLTERFLGDEEYELALWSWTECIRAWRGVLTTPYMEDVLDDIIQREDADDEDAEQDRRRIVTELLDPLIDRRAHDLRQSLRLDDDARRTEAIPRRRVRFCWSALMMARELTREVGEDPFNTLTRLHERATHTCEEIAAQVCSRLTRMIEEIEIAEADGADLLRPFEWAAAAFEIIGMTERASIQIVEQVVTLGWKLHKMGREEGNADFTRILEVTAPFNDDLRRRFEHGEAFGHNAKCADFLVFQGERIDDHDRRFKTFQRAVEISPGHRNASMLLSYEYLIDANDLLNQLALMPTPVRYIPGSGRAEKLVEQTARVLELVRETYPPNEDLDTYEQRLHKQAERFRIDMSRFTYRDEEDSP